MEATRQAFAYDGAFQTKVVRVLFEDQEFCASIGVKLDPKLFDGKIRRWLASTLISHAKKYGVGASLDAVKIRLQRDLKVRRLLESDRPAAEAAIEKLKRPVRDRSFVKEEIFRFVKNQVVQDVIVNSLKHLDSMDFEAIDAEFSRIHEVNALSMGGLGHFFVRDVEQRLELRKAEIVKNGVPTGFKLDEYIKYGGLWPKSLTTVMGGYHRGKSAMMVSMARAAILEGSKKVLYVTLDESDENQICDRFDAGFADVSLSDLAEDGDVVRQAVEDVGIKYGECLVVKEFPPGYLTVPMLASYVRQLEAKAFYPDVVVIDYADYMVPSIAREKRHESESNLFVELRSLAVQLKKVFITANQINREGMDRELADGRFTGGSIAKPQVSDVVLIINQTAKEKKAQVARIWVDKNRGGSSSFEIPVRTDWSRNVVSDRG